MIGRVSYLYRNNICYVLSIAFSLYIMISISWRSLAALRIIIRKGWNFAIAYRAMVYFNCWHWFRAKPISSTMALNTCVPKRSTNTDIDHYAMYLQGARSFIIELMNN